MNQSNMLRAAFLSLFFCLTVQFSFAQTPTTSISATYQDLDDATGDYSINGAGGSYDAGTMYNLSFSSNSTANNNLILDYITVGVTNYYLSFEIATPIFRRNDNAVWTGDVEFVFHELNSSAGSDLDFSPSLAIDMEAALNSSIINRGTDNVFVNNDTGNGNNIERMDYVFSTGITPGNALEQGFVLFERNGNDNIRMAAILSVDGTNTPTAFGPLVAITSGATWGNSTFNITTTTFRDVDNTASIDLRPRDDVGSQNLKGCWVTCDDLGITAGQTFYGYALFGFDTPAGTSSANLLDWTNTTYFPTNTASGNGGSDMISGGLFLTPDFLPIELVDFSGNSGQCSHQLNWTTASERNNDYFSVEQSFDGETFIQVGKVQGAGNSQEFIDYSFELNNLVNESAYYRIRQVDFDGKYSFSSVIQLENNCGSSISGLVEIFPNPASKSIRLNGLSSRNGSGTVVIINSVGATVRSFELDLPEGKFIREMDISKLPTGQYFLLFISSDGSRSLETFQKVSYN